ncbi:relaxase/mobilization nuclease domain-containing protein [Chitinophagaceae bacterium 26-R-25]|nr:relaxase/mobilization nuclease domain-containing protein [Chitinophagaceae bacterium 26-R-25]
MISKHVTAHSFYHTCRYIEQKPGAELLLSEGVRSYDVRLMAEDFVRQQQLRPSKTQACLHAILSFYPGEKPSDDRMKEITKEYFKKLGIENTQYAVTKHTDKAHLHLHIVANMVNNDGKAIKDNWLGLKGKKIAQELTQKYELRPALEKDLKLTHLERLSDYEMGKYKIYIAINEQLLVVKTMEELEVKLQKQGIETCYKYKGKTEEKQGVSFRIDGYSYKGSEVDRKFSLKKLEQTISQSQKMELKNSYTQTMQSRFRDNEKVIDRRIDTREIDEQTGKVSLKEKVSPIQDLGNKLLERLTIDEQKEGVPKELTEEIKQKRKRENSLDR